MSIVIFFRQTQIFIGKYIENYTLLMIWTEATDGVNSFIFAIRKYNNSHIFHHHRLCLGCNNRFCFRTAWKGNLKKIRQREHRVNIYQNYRNKPMKLPKFWIENAKKPWHKNDLSSFVWSVIRKYTILLLIKVRQEYQPTASLQLMMEHQLYKHRPAVKHHGLAGH